VSGEACSSLVGYALHVSTEVTGYAIDEFLGSGGIADVYRAVSEADGRVVALKILREPDRSRANVRRFLREGFLLQRLVHDGLPACYAVIEEPRPVLALEVLEGCTLSERLSRSGSLSADQVFGVALSMLRVLGFLHHRGVIHRDVKASNIFLCQDGRVMLMDLGLAMDPEDPFTTTLGDVMGTYAYMAPEQIAGAEVDARSDLYSLGITLYEALCGRRPYSARGTAGYLRAHRAGGAQPLAERVSDAPIRLMDFIHQLMARDPSARPSSAGIAAALLTGRESGHNELRAPPLVGRMAARGAIEAVIDGTGVVHLVGEIGAGTGRVARLALQIAHDGGLECIALRFRPWGVQRHMLPQLANALAFILDAEVPPQLDRVREALVQLEAEGPFLLLLEDLHLALDEDLAQLPELLAAVPEASVVTTSLFSHGRLPGREVALRSLEREEVSRLVATMLGSSSPPASLAGMLHRETGGLPALVVQAVRELHGRGALRCDGLDDDGEPQWTLDAGAAHVGSFGLRPLFRQALTDLPRGGHRALEVLAVAGGALPMEVLIAASSVDRSGLDVHNLIRLGLATLRSVREEDWIAIRRPALTSLVHEGLSAERQREVHRALAEALEPRVSDPWRDESLALHQVLGAEGEGKLRDLIELGARALESGEVVRVRTILAHLTEHPPEDSLLNAEVALLRGQLMLRDGRLEEARVAFVAARQLARESGEARLVGWATLGLARVQLETGSGIRCEALTLEAEKTFALMEPERSALGWLAYLKGTCSFLRGSERSALERFQAAAREAESAGEPELLSFIHCGTAMVHSFGGRADQAGRFLADTLERCGRKRACPAACCMMDQLASIRISEGLLGEAIEQLDRALRTARELGHPYLEARMGVSRARVHLAAGDLQGAQNLMRRYRAAREPRADVLTRLAHHVTAGELRFQAGDRQAALASFDQATDIARKLGHAVIAAYGEGMTGVLTASAHPLEDALDVLEKVKARQYMARLLLAGAQIVGDAAAVSAAVRVARQAGDKPVLLRALHVQGGEEAWAEAVGIAMDLRDGAGSLLRRHISGLPALRWALEAERRS
jgi:tetratricopeptide (TPR) repeat protein